MSGQTPTIPVLETFLRLTSLREKAISTNMANVDTPGYHTRDIDFQAELSRAMYTVSDGENGGTMRLDPVAREVPGLMERADGNNVDIDREGLVMSQVQLQYQLGIQLIRDQFHSILSAIKDGN